MNKENLQRMADYIRTIPKELFDMGEYRTGQTITNECDSVGCVLGHCTVLNPDPLPKDRFGSIDFNRWAYKFTGTTENEWVWCFGSTWRNTDNTTEGAALRIEWLIKHGLPENWRAQYNNETPLCYKGGES
jgi:hypothetical protein